MSNILSSSCLHCKKEIEVPYEINFCCGGCYFVFQFITSHDLSKYYELLKNLGENNPSLKNRDENEISWFERENFSQLFQTEEDKYSLFLPDMKCAACLWIIEAILKKYPEIENININLMQKILSFSKEKYTQIPLAIIAKDLYLCGYKPLPLPFSSSQEFRNYTQKLYLKEIAISGFASGNIMLLYIGIYFGNFFGIEPYIKNSFYYISMLIAIPSVLYSGRSFFKNSFQALKLKKLHIDTTISFAIIVTLITSIYATFYHKDYIYYDTLTGLVFLLLISRYFHEKYLLKSQELSEFVETLIPKESFLIKPGDLVDIPVGKIIPVDGIIQRGCTEVNEAALTGEERAVFKKETDHVLAGSQNLTQPILISAEKTGHNTWIAQLTKLIAHARNEKSQIETQLEKILPLFTYSILFLALFSLVLWYFINPTDMLSVFTALLVVTCPCALALSTPLTFSIALKTYWKHGIIVKNSAAIETLTKVDTIVLDKTGTLTSEFITITKVICRESNATLMEQKNALAQLAHVAKRSLHPVARAVASAYFDSQTPVIINTIKEYPGLGLSAEITDNNGETIVIQLGNKRFLLCSPSDDEMIDKLVYAKIGNLNFIFYLEETLKEGVIHFIDFLQKMKQNVYLLSGDCQNNVDKIANKLNIQQSNAIGQMLPHEKLNFLEKLQEKNKIVLAMGDGVNDAAMLMKAHVSIATHGGVDMAIQAADIFLLKKNFNQLIDTFQYAFYTLRTLKSLFLFSLFYNIIVIIIALCHFVTPLLAAILMPLSSLIVFLFSLSRTGEKIWKS